MADWRGACLGVVLTTAALAFATAARAAPDLSGMWVLTTGETSVVHLSDLSLTPLGRARMEARQKEIANGFPVSEGHLKCDPAGMPQMMSAPFGIQIMQNDNRILIAPEVSNLPRTIFFRAAHLGPDDLNPSWNGDSIGHWEGDVLVVDTIGFNDEDALDRKSVV